MKALTFYHKDTMAQSKEFYLFKEIENYRGTGQKRMNRPSK